MQSKTLLRGHDDVHSQKCINFVSLEDIVLILRKLVSLNLTLDTTDLLTRIMNYNNCTKIGENCQHSRAWSENYSRNCEVKRPRTFIVEDMPWQHIVCCTDQLLF